MRRGDILTGYRAHMTAGNFSIMFLRLSYALFLIAVGFDKILHLNMIANWVQFIGPGVHLLLPVPSITIISIEGIIEIVLAVLLLTTWIRFGAIILLLTTLLASVDLFILGFYNLGLHYLLFCAGIIVLISHYNKAYQQKFTVTPFSEVAPVA